MAKPFTFKLLNYFTFMQLADVYYQSEYIFNAFSVNQHDHATVTEHRIQKLQKCLIYYYAISLLLNIQMSSMLCSYVMVFFTCIS